MFGQINGNYIDSRKGFVRLEGGIASGNERLKGLMERIHVLGTAWILVVTQ